MTLADFLTSWFAIATSGFFSALFAYLLFFKFREILDWEAEHIWKPLKRSIRKLLRKSKRLVAWAEKPAKHGKPDADFIAGQVKVFGDVWK